MAKKKLIGYHEELKWWERFTIALTKRQETKAEVLRRLVRGWTEDAEAEDEEGKGAIGG